MASKNINPSVAQVLDEVIRDIVELPEFDGVDKIIIITSKPVPGQKDCGLLTIYSNAKPIESMSVCDHVAEEISNSLECQCPKCVAEREAGNVPVVH